MAEPGPRQNFPSFLTAINFPSGRFLVIELYKKSLNAGGTTLTPVAASFEDFDPSKIMPFTAGAKRSKKPDDLDLKKDKALTSATWEDTSTLPPKDGEAAQDKEVELRRIIFINVGLVEKGMKPDKRKVTYNIKLDGIEGGDPQGQGRYAYWVWQTDPAGIGLGEPPSTADEAVSPHTMHFVWGDQVWSPWIGPLNGQNYNDNANFYATHGVQYGLPAPRLQGNSGFGFDSAEDQQQSIGAINAIINADHQQSDPNGPTPATYYAISFFFPDSNPDTQQHKVDYEIKAHYYAGRLNFPYDDQSVKQFPDGADDSKSPDAQYYTATYTTTKSKPSTASVMQVTLDKDNHVTIAQES